MRCARCGVAWVPPQIITTLMEAPPVVAPSQRYKRLGGGKIRANLFFGGDGARVGRGGGEAEDFGGAMPVGVVEAEVFLDEDVALEPVFFAHQFPESAEGAQGRGDGEDGPVAAVDDFFAH